MREKSRTGFYAVVLGGTVCLFGKPTFKLSPIGGLGYVIVKELLAPNGSYHIIDQAVDRLRQNTKVHELIGGSDFKFYGMGDGRKSRRRPIIHQRLLEDGRNCIDANFYIEGDRRARVTLQAVEGEDGRWEERYLALDLPGQPTQVLIQPIIKPRTENWHPFRWFQ